LTALQALLRQGAVAHGWPNHLWTAGRVAVLIRRHFGISHHPEHVRKILKKRLGWTSQKPQKHARECNDREVERWIADDWPRIIRQAFQRRARIALLDESGFMLSPTVRRTPRRRRAPSGSTHPPCRLFPERSRLPSSPPPATPRGGRPRTRS